MSSLVRYVPPAVNIASISNSYPAIVTTAVAHGYITGIIVRIVIPYPHVMEQLNMKEFIGIVNSPTTFGIAYNFNGRVADVLNLSFVDSTNFGPWAAGPLVTCTIPQPQPLPPLPPIPPAPAVTFTVSGQVAQAVPTGELAITLRNASDVIGPRNP